MSLHAQTISSSSSPLCPVKVNTKCSTTILPSFRRAKPLTVSACFRRDSSSGNADARTEVKASRRQLLLLPSLAFAASCFLSATSRAEETNPPPVAPSTPEVKPVEVPKEKKEEEPELLSRVYDATVIGEPVAVGKDKKRVWEKLLAARVVYLGEAELVPDKDDRVLELEIVKNLKKRCAELERPVSIAMEAFPRDLQEQLNQFLNGRIDGQTLKSYTSHWPEQRWQEYEPLLNYSRENKIKIIACGTPLQILRTVQAEGIRGLSKSERKLYTPPAGSGFISGFTSISTRSLLDQISSTNQTVPFLSAQVRVIDDYTISQSILQTITKAPATAMLIVITGASHVMHGSRGIGVPARISRHLQKKKQVVVMLDPERQDIRREGEIPVADFLWYSARKPCSRNCFDRAEIARVMNGAGRRREALPQDLQNGLDLGVVSPEILQNFFDLEKYPLISELTHRFQGFRERLLADPKFLNRLAIEEGISITTTLIAQYERRKGRFFEEIDYVLTDTIRGIVVDFFTVWLPAPTISFLSYSNDSSSETLEIFRGLFGSFPDNAFQKSVIGSDWSMTQRVGAVLVGGLKLAGVGVVSSFGAGFASDLLYGVRRFLNPDFALKNARKRTPILKTAAVYGSFLGTSANLRYQVIAGLVEHRLSDYLISYYNEPALANVLSFVVRTINSYYGTQQWIDLARYTGIQKSKPETESSSVQVLDSPEMPLLETSSEIPLLECTANKLQNVEENNNNNNNNNNQSSEGQIVERVEDEL